MSIIELRVGGRFKLKRNISHGSFGDIYIAQNVQTNEEVAVKLEDTKTKYPQLIYEAKILYSIQGGSGVPNLIWCGQEGDYNILVMELLGDTIEDMFNLCSKRLSMKSVLMIVDQSLQLIEYIHNKGFLHRDLKPENILLGLGRKCHLLHFIDYGLAKRYRDPKTGKHIPIREGKQLTGTAKFASLNTHQGLEQSRRDDLEALGFVFVYLYKGTLPWQRLAAEDKQDRYAAIYEEKLKTSPKELCAGMPEEFESYFEYCRRLRFDEKPDYTYLRRTFKELFLREGYEFDYIFDWMLIPLKSQLDLDINKVIFDVEFTASDDFMNYNIKDLDIKKGDEARSPYFEGKGTNQGNDEEENVAKDLGKGAAALIGNPKTKPKPKPKPIETEYLRTDYKLANIPSPNNLKSPNMQLAEKKKDCNMF